MEGDFRENRDRSKPIDKIFNVRKLPYKQFDNQKYLKENCSPLKVNSKKELTAPFSITQSPNMEYHFQLTLTSSPAYRQLESRFRVLKEEHRLQRQHKLQFLRQKEQELEKIAAQRRRLELQQQKLLARKDELCDCIDRLRQRRQWHQMQGEQLSEPQDFEQILMAMHYQGGVDIDPDQMTYEELLQLQQKMGKVSKGLSEEQLTQLPTKSASKEQEGEKCSICYCEVAEGEQLLQLPCSHLFHCSCIREWLLQERVCPLCKQELSLH